MSFHFHFTPPRRRQRRSTRVIDGWGQPINRLDRRLSPASELPWRPSSPASPAELPPAAAPRTVKTVHQAPTWESRLRDLKVFWTSIDDRFTKLDQLVHDKSEFDADQMRKWSEHIAIKRVDADRDADAGLLDMHADDSTSEMRDLQRQIRERILADALAGHH